MGLDFNESDILKDILNFKIVNRKKLEEKYGFKIIDRMIKHINEFLCKNDNGIIHKSKIIYIILENIMKAYLR